MKKRVLNVLSIISVAILIPAATLVSLHLNILNRITTHDFVSAPEGYILVAQTFLLNNIFYLASLFVTLFIFFITGARANIKLLILPAAATIMLAIPQLTWIVLSNVSADTLIFRFFFQLFFDIEKTLMLFSINFIIYVLLIIRELRKRKAVR